MNVHELSRADARRIAVRAQLLDGARPDGLLDAVRHLTLLHNAQTAAIAPNADLVLWSRLGPSYQPAELADALARQTLLDLRGMIRPSEDLALYRADMADWPAGASCTAGRSTSGSGWRPISPAAWTSLSGFGPTVTGW